LISRINNERYLGCISELARASKTFRFDARCCTGHKLCLSEAPDILGYDDAANQVFVKPGAESLFDTKAADIYSAASVCPMDAILINGSKVQRQK